MTQVIEAVYENGALHPIGKLDLLENARVRIAVQPLTDGKEEGEPPLSDPLEGLRVATGITDLAEHFDDYRFGRRQP